MSGARLAIRGLGKTYPNGARALHDVNLAIAGGEIVAVVGGSGSGKSTLLRILAGLDHATEGEASVDDTVIREPQEAVGLIFQEPRLLAWLSVLDNVAFGLAGLGSQERRGRAAAALEKVGLAQFAARWPRELSGGQAQRVAIARALVVRPTVLLLDEPFSALDAFTRVDLQDHLLELWSDSRPTTLLVTHDIEEAIVLADRVVVLKPSPGRIATTFPVALRRPRDRFAPEFEDAKRHILLALGRSLTDHHPRGQAAATSWAALTGITSR